MHNTTDRYLFQIEPTKDKSEEPIIDDLTEKMEYLLQIADEGDHYRGFHICSCGEISGCCDLIIGGYITNSLATHYLKWHRLEVPESEIEKLRNIEI